MKSRDFAQVLMQVAELAGESRVRKGLIELAGIFDQAGTATVAGTLKRAVSASEGLSTAPLLPHMRRVQSLLTLAGKPAVAKDFSDVVSLAQQYPAIAFSSRQTVKRAPRANATLSTVNADLTNRYNTELNAALGNESGFAAVYSRLETDPQICPAELRDLSRKFAGAPGKTKSDSLKKIWNRHESILALRAKDRAMAGRSAA